MDGSEITVADDSDNWDNYESSAKTFAAENPEGAEIAVFVDNFSFDKSLEAS